MSRGRTRVHFGPSHEGWVRRPLLFAVILILILTLFPFQFLPQETVSRRAPSVLHWLNSHPTGASDFLENVLLFAPFGFGLTCWLTEKHRLLLLRAVAAGAAFSCLIEYLQMFLPTRTSQWWDVIANTLGSVLGYLIFETAGEALLRAASAVEAKTAHILAGRRNLAVFVVYTGLMLVVSAALQQSTSLTHWAKSDRLWIGNDASNHHPWQGKILRVGMTDETVAPDYFSGGKGATAPGSRSQSVAAHLLLDLRADEAVQVNDNRAPDKSPRRSPAEASSQTGATSLRGERSASALVNQLRKTNRFTLWVRCIPTAAAENSFGTLVSFSRDSHHADFFMAEERGRWVVGIREALGGRSRYWDLDTANDLKPGEPLDIVVTYDGADLSASINGKLAALPLRLNAGANLVCCFKGIDPYNVRGYGLLYDGLVFVPLGFLLALGARRPADRKPRRWPYLAIGLLLPAVLLEALLFLVSHRPFQIENVILGSCLISGAFLILSSDQGVLHRLAE